MGVGRPVGHLRSGVLPATMTILVAGGHFTSTMTFGTIVRRFVFYLGLALAALALFTLVFALSIRTHVVVPFRWVMLAVFTVVLAVAMIKACKRYWARPVFWLSLAGFLGIHLTVFIELLHSYPDFRVFWFVSIGMVEGAVFEIACMSLFDRATEY